MAQSNKFLIGWEGAIGWRLVESAGGNVWANIKGGTAGSGQARGGVGGGGRGDILVLGCRGLW